jgi:hypothetical protein
LTRIEGKQSTTDLKLTRYPRSLAATRRGFSFCLAVPIARLVDDADICRTSATANADPESPCALVIENFVGQRKLVEKNVWKKDSRGIFRTERFVLMSNREIVIDLVGKLPEDTPFEEIAREIELLAGIQRAREQARRREGIPAEDARKLINKWASR